MAPSIAELLDDWEKAVRQGQGQEIKVFLENLKPEPIPKRYYSKICNLARRIGAYGFAFSFCQDYFFSAENYELGEDFIGEYASLVSEVGAGSVAEKLFASIKVPGLAKTHYLRALHFMRSWRYRDAEKELLLFLSKETESYWVQLGRLNLISCYICNEKWSKAELELKELEKESHQLAPMARGVLCEQWGELLFFSSQFREAEKQFTKSLSTLQQTNSPSYFYAAKWVHIIKLLDGSDPSHSSWHQFYKQAKQKGYWEVIREMDRYYGLKTADENLLLRVYFGTPYSEYRERLKNQVGLDPSQGFATNPAKDSEFRRGSGDFYFQGKKQKAPDLLRILLMEISRDLYRPASSAFLFDAVYSNQFYGPAFAKQRVYSLISRFRKFNEEKSLHFEITPTSYGFRVNDDDVNIVYSLKEKEISQQMDHGQIIAEIKELYVKEPFAAKDIAAHFSVSPRTANRIVSKGVKAGDFIKIGKSKGARFKIAG